MMTSSGTIGIPSDHPKPPTKFPFRSGSNTITKHQKPMKTHQNKSTKTYKNVKHDQTPSNTNQSPSKTIKNNQQLIKKTITHHQEPTENTLNTKKSNKPQQTMLRKKNISPGDLKKHQNVLLASLCFAPKRGPQIRSPFRSFSVWQRLVGPWWLHHLGVDRS